MSNTDGSGCARRVHFWRRDSGSLPIGHSVQVQFAKNGVREFALVIGADGIHSNLRQLAFGDESRFLRDLGLYLCVYSVPNYLKLDRMEMQYSELGRVAAISSSRGDAN